MKTVTIQVDEDIVSDMADILCYLAGVADSKGEDWRNAWIMDAAKNLRLLKAELHTALKDEKLKTL